MPLGLDVFVNRYVLTGQLETCTALHIGSGAAESLDPRRPDGGVVVDSGSGLPYVPGSSLKGACRGWLRRVVRARDPGRACADDCGAGGLESLCPVCRLFGSPSFGGRIFFADAPVLSMKRPALETRAHVRLDPDLGVRLQGGLFDMEVVPPGHRFSVEWYADNVDEEDLQHLHLLRAAMEEGMISLGGAASRGLGRVRLRDADETMEDLETLSRLIAEPASVPRARLMEALGRERGDRITMEQLRQAYDRAAEAVP